MPIIDDLQEVLRKNLPEQTVGILREELKKLEDLPSLLSKIENLTKECQSLGEQNGKLLRSNTELNKELEGWKKREEDISNRERNLKMTLLETQLAEAEKRATIGQELTKIVFQNRTITELMSHYYPNGNQPVFGPNGQVATPVPSSTQITTIGN